MVRDYEALPADSVEPIVTVLDDPLDTTEIVFVAGAGGRVVKALADALKSANIRGGTSEKITDLLQARARPRRSDACKNDAGSCRHRPPRRGRGADRRARRPVGIDLRRRRPARARRRDALPERPGVGATVRAHEPDRGGRRRRLARGAAPAAHGVEPDAAQADAPAPGARHPRGPLPQARPARLRRGPHRRRRAPSGAWAVEEQELVSRRRRRSKRRGRSVPTGFARAFAELHRADIGVKGATGLPEETVIEITVARLADLHRSGSRAVRAAAAPGGARR